MATVKINKTVKWGSGTGDYIYSNCQLRVTDDAANNQQKVETYHRVYVNSKWTDRTYVNLRFYTNGSTVYTKNDHPFDYDEGTAYYQKVSRGWTSLGYKKAGTKITIRTYAYWKGGSGATRKVDTGTQSYTVPTFQTEPGYVSNFQAKTNQDNTITVSWAATATSTKPITGFYLDSLSNTHYWQNVKGEGVLISASARSINLKAVKNSAYSFRIFINNDQGMGPESHIGDIFYSVPAAPKEAKIVRKENDLNYYVDVSNVYHYTSIEWEGSVDSSFSNPIEIDFSELSGKDNIAELNPEIANCKYFRVRVLIDEIYSDWTNVVYVDCPACNIMTDSPIKEIYYQQ